jgi:predicted flap endonuclease-1-like 5' DNA nuclease
MAKLTDIEGIGAVYSSKLQVTGIATQEQLLERGAHPAERQRLERETGISHKLLLKWLNRADLARIKGIGEEYADLLERAGIDTVPELAQRNASHLHTAMTEVNKEKLVVRQLPSASQVAEWIQQAKGLERALFY